MSRSLRHLAAALAVAGLLLAPSVAPASTSTHSGNGGLTQLEMSNAHPVFDALFIRPLGLAGLGISAAFWLPAQAITMAVRPSDWRTPIDYMLRRPFEFVFVDPLGSH
jgi:hypothetical protein